MITPSSGSITITPPTKIYDGIWIKNVNIQSYSTSLPVVASVIICPFNSQTGDMSDEVKTIEISDVLQSANSSSYIAEIIKNLYAYVQTQIMSQSLY
jgi:hypothetical protein